MKNLKSYILIGTGALLLALGVFLPNGDPVLGRIMNPQAVGVAPAVADLDMNGYDLTDVGSATLGTTTTSMLNGVIVVDGVHYAQTGAGIQEAIDAQYALGGGVVYLPSGTYIATTSIILKSNVSLVGSDKYTTTVLGSGFDGSTIQTVLPGYVSTSTKDLYSNISLHNITFESDSNYIASLFNTDGLTVTNCIFQHVAPYPAFTAETLYIEHSRNVNVQGNYIYNSYGDGIQINAVDYFVVSNNIVYAINDDGIDIDMDFISLKIEPSRWGTVTGNQVFGGDGNNNGIRIEDSQYISVVGNQISDSAVAGIIVNNDDTNPIDMYGINIIGNQIDGSTLAGISVSGDQVWGTLIADNHITNSALATSTAANGGIVISSASTTASNNYIFNSGNNDANSGAIVLYSQDNVVINSNTISSSTVGINFWNGSCANTYTHVSVLDNVFDTVETNYYNTCDVLSQVGNGIYMQGHVFNENYSSFVVGTTSAPGYVESFVNGNSENNGTLRVTGIETSGSFTAGVGIEIRYDTNNSRSSFLSYDRSASQYKPIDFDASSFTFSTGNVGIGTASPATKLDVYNATATSTAYIYSGGAGLGGRLILEDVDGAGCTEVVALNGVLTASTVTCP